MRYIATVEWQADPGQLPLGEGTFEEVRAVARAYTNGVAGVGRWPRATYDARGLVHARSEYLSADGQWFTIELQRDTNRYVVTGNRLQVGGHLDGCYLSDYYARNVSADTVDDTVARAVAAGWQSVTASVEAF